MATFDQKRLRAGAAQCFIPTNFGPASAQKERRCISLFHGSMI